MDAEIPVPTVGHGLRRQALHLLRDHADIGLAAAEIAESVVAETIGEMTEQDDIVLQCDVGAPSAAATTTEATTTATATESAATSAAEATAPSTGKRRSAAATSGETRSASAARTHTRPTASRLRCSGPARRHVHGRAAITATARGAAAAIGGLRAITATLGARLAAIRCARAIATIGTRPIARGRAVASTITGAIAHAISAARSILSRTKHLLPVAAAEIHPIGGAGLQVVVAEALLDVRIVVSHALAMRGVVLPVVPDVVGPVVVVDVEVAVAPVASAAPVIAPASDRPGCAEGETGRDHTSADIGRVAEVIGWIFRIRPGSIDRGRIVVRHVHRIGIGLLDDDRLHVFLRLNADLLLLGGDELLAVIGLGAKALDRVHHIRLLREHGIAQVLGPVDLVAHHRNDVCGARERLDAVVP